MSADNALAPDSSSQDEFCPKCGKWVNSLTEAGWCVGCSPPTNKVSAVESYLSDHADELEFYLIQGKTLNQAIDLVHIKNGRPTCVVCGQHINRARRNAIFCRTTKECRRLSRRYVYLYREKIPTVTKSQALAMILEELT